METIFLNAAGTTLFTRSDMEEGHWTQEEYTVNATFPWDAGKVIQRGQRMAFRDPATDALEVFEIRDVTNIEPDHYQQIIAEHIAVAELSDEHTDEKELTDVTTSSAVSTVLTGTLWSRGNVTASGTSSADIARGSVWEALNTIATNWNCYIVPRVVFNAAGAITGRYIDVTPAEGTFRGVRLSISKNMSDSSVVYDDTDVLTALYGYGGMETVTHQGSDDTQEVLTFADSVWSATSAHPAKPSGQKYLEWPEKTALYGRNGRPRFGFYQNADIDDADTLLEKTWEALKETAEPKISISGTVSDLYRLGYKDQPLRLHDIAIVEIAETGETFQKEIIKLDVDLIDPTANRPEIGDYIKNIIYISRDTEEKTTGGGGGGGRGKTNKEQEESETYTDFIKTNNMIGMVVGTRNGGYYIKAGQIVLAINKSGETGQYESSAYIDADHVNISATQDVYTLAGELERDANGRLIIKSAGGMYVQRTESGTTVQVGVWDKGNLTGGIMVTQINGQSAIKIKADVIDVEGVLTAQNLQAGISRISTLQVSGLAIGNASFSVGSGGFASWQSQSVVTGVTANSTSAGWLYGNSSLEITGRSSSSMVHSITTTTATIHYLGQVNT